METTILCWVLLRVQGLVSASNMNTRTLVMVFAKGTLDFREEVILS